MVMPKVPAVALRCTAVVVLLAACTSDRSTSPPASRSTAFAVASRSVASALPSGERQLGRTSIEPAYDAATGNLTYLITPEKSPFPTKANARSWAPLYLIEYPAGSTVGTLNCMGVPGNCPDHDAAVAGVAMQAMPSVYGNGVIGHDHLVDIPGGEDFNVAWQVFEVVFTSAAAANEHITTEDAMNAAINRGDAIMIDLGFAFTCAVVPSVTYWNGTPVS